MYNSNNPLNKKNAVYDHDAISQSIYDTTSQHDEVLNAVFSFGLNKSVHDITLEIRYIFKKSF
jgi:hypothetical protein